MDIKNFTYSKPDKATREENLIPTQKKTFQKSPPPPRESSIVNNSEIVNYSKEEPQLTQSLFFVLSGGEIRERTYLQELEKKGTFKRLRIIFLSSLPKMGGLTPTMMNAQWGKILKDKNFTINGTPYKFEDIDKTFFLTDVDHYEKELRNLISQPTLQAEWIISNPDFEIWLYYSFYNNPESDLADLKKSSASKRSSLLKTLNGQFNHGGGIDTRKAFENIQLAIQHSKNHYKEDSVHFPELYSTQMHQFAEEVLNVIEYEFKLWEKNKKDKIKQFMKRNRI
ncbi:MAG: RloB domain-containing protein [Bacteroidaceae bacterium]